jgi:hypothetical protein
VIIRASWLESKCLEFSHSVLPAKIFVARSFVFVFDKRAVPSSLPRASWHTLRRRTPPRHPRPHMLADVAAASGVERIGDAYRQRRRGIGE